MKIDFAKLQYQYQLYKTEIDEAIHNVLDKSNYIMGNEVKDLEDNLQTFTGAKHAITCSSGTDALLLAMMALDIKPNDEIITTPFTFIATAETIAFLGAKPVFVDIDEKTYNLDPKLIEAKITEKTKVIMPVSLYGQPADMEAIQSIANKHNLKVIVDGAQSFGSTFGGKRDSNLGDISTTSFFPAKPLGCFGDGGAVFTNDDALAEKMKSLRVHGQSKRYHHKYIGIGGRIDTIQCAIIDVKLKHYKKDLALRQEVASKYSKALKDKDLVLPFVDDKATSAFAQYSVRVQNRDDVQAKLKEQGVPTAVHYPMPLHLQECFAYLGYKEGDFPIAELISNEIMSLPMNPYVRDNEIEYIARRIRPNKLPRKVNNMEKINLDFCFKGARDYVHGTDIYTKLQKYVNLNAVKPSFDLTIHGISHTNMLLSHVQPEERNKLRFVCKYMDENGKKKVMYGVENNIPITCQYDYNEDIIIESAIINIPNKEISLPTKTRFKFVENVVALNKYLLESMFPDAVGKWYFTRLQLSHDIGNSDEIIKLLFKSNFNFKLTKTEIFIEDKSVGYIYFSLV